MPVIPRVQKQGMQKGYGGFETSLGYHVRLCLENQKQKPKTKTKQSPLQQNKNLFQMIIMKNKTQPGRMELTLAASVLNLFCLPIEVSSFVSRALYLEWFFLMNK